MNESVYTTTGAITAGYLAGRRPHATISVEECERIGGHCWERTNEVLASNPPQYPEACRHCTKRRVGVPQAAMRYYDPDKGIDPFFVSQTPST